MCLILHTWPSAVLFNSQHVLLPELSCVASTMFGSASQLVISGGVGATGAAGAVGAAGGVLTAAC